MMCYECVENNMVWGDVFPHQAAHCPQRWPLCLHHWRHVALYLMADGGTPRHKDKGWGEWGGGGVEGRGKG